MRIAGSCCEISGGYPYSMSMFFRKKMANTVPITHMIMRKLMLKEISCFIFLRNGE